MAEKEERAACKHCGKVNQIRHHGLCTTCYKKREVREAFGASSWAPEPTMQELDEMIAEQSKCLPSWWRSEVGRD